MRAKRSERAGAGRFRPAPPGADRRHGKTRGTALATALPTALGAILVVAAAAAGGADATAPRPAPGEGPAPVAPSRLSETGLYAPDGSIAPEVRPFSPQYPLWTDGAAKARWILLPAGATIDVSDVDAWGFPVGTRLWKEFAWDGHRVETRMLWKASEDRWVFAAYAWDEDQAEARLAPAEGIANAFAIAPGKFHSIPGTADCAACHESSPATVLGFNALQLSDDRDPLAPHAEIPAAGSVTLRSLVEADLLRPPRPDLAANPPRIRAGDPVARAALGYLAGNCGGCHNSRGPLGRLGLDLSHSVAAELSATEPAIATALDMAGRYRMPGVPPDSSRLIAPGAPERSALLHRMGSRRPSSQMPPLGTVVADEEALRLVRQWIATLEPAGGEPLTQHDDAARPGERRE